MRLVNSCVPVSVQRLDKDKDADEDVDADRDGTGRALESERSIELFTQREEIDIDFRVPGLPHAFVNKLKTSVFANSLKKIESHPHREALEADLQQSNALQPIQ